MYKLLDFKTIDQLKPGEETKVLFIFNDVNDSHHTKNYRLQQVEASITMDKEGEIYIHSMPTMGSLVIFDLGKYANGRGAKIAEAIDAVEVVDYKVTKSVEGYYQIPKDGRKARHIRLLQVVSVNYKRK